MLSGMDAETHFCTVLKVGADTFETSPYFFQTARCYIPEDLTIKN
jgi:hypothetical protein